VPSAGLFGFSESATVGLGLRAINAECDLEKAGTPTAHVLCWRVMSGEFGPSDDELDEAAAMASKRA